MADIVYARMIMVLPLSETPVVCGAGSYHAETRPSVRLLFEVRVAFLIQILSPSAPLLFSPLNLNRSGQTNDILSPVTISQWGG